MSRPKLKGKDRWKLLRDDVHSIVQARPRVWHLAAWEAGPKPQEAPVEPLESPCSPALSEPAPEPGLEADGGDGEAGAVEFLVLGSGEDFSDCSEAQLPTAYEAVEVKQVAKVELCVPLPASSARERLNRRRSRTQAASPGVMGGMISGLSSMAGYKETPACGNEVHNTWGDSDTATAEDLGQRVTDLEGAGGTALGPFPSAARMRRAKRNEKQKQEAASSSSPAFVSTFTVASMFSSFTTTSPSGSKAYRADPLSGSAQERPGSRNEGQPEAPMATTGVMASMISGLSSMAGYKTEVASDDEVHNAWGEDDTAEDFGQRVADLERARGIVLGPARSAARMRRARKKEKNKPEEASKASSSSSPAFMSTLTVASMMSFPSRSAAPAAAASTVRGLAVPMPTQSSGRERFARRRAVVSSRSESLTSSRVSSEALSETGPWAQLARKARKAPRSSFLEAAGRGLADLQQFFSEEEVHNIWGLRTPRSCTESGSGRWNVCESHGPACCIIGSCTGGARRATTPSCWPERA